MFQEIKIGRNDPCPCGSGSKFKHCCSGHVDWEAILRDKRDWRPFLSVRGRNLNFINEICNALGLGPDTPPPDLAKYKSAFTADAVRKIHEALMATWPRNLDLPRALGQSAGTVSGLYIGDYGPAPLMRGIVRHCIYASKIVLVDPFIYPTSVRDEYNAILNPEQYRSQTLKNVNLWFGLSPWIEAGIVEVVRSPTDFDPQLNWKILQGQKEKYEQNAELRTLSEKSVEELSRRHTEEMARQRLLLGAPDSYLRQTFEKLGLGRDGLTVDDFIKSVQTERDRDPNFLKPMDQLEEAQTFTVSSGASYPAALMIADLTGSYLFTDIAVKWREIELDREAHGAENKVWAPFAKALQDAPFKYLNSVRLEHALTLRKEGRLESLRRFLHRVWQDARAANEFGAENARLLAEELGEKVREAEREWDQIDKDLLKIVGATAVPELLAAGPLIAAGHALFLAAAVAAGGLGALAWSTQQRRTFPDRFPAAFFMKI